MSGWEPLAPPQVTFVFVAAALSALTARRISARMRMRLSHATFLLMRFASALSMRRSITVVRPLEMVEPVSLVPWAVISLNSPSMARSSLPSSMAAKAAGLLSTKYWNMSLTRTCGASVSRRSSRRLSSVRQPTA